MSDFNFSDDHGTGVKSELTGNIGVSPEFTGGLKLMGSNFDSLSDDEKLSIYQQASVEAPTVHDLTLISPFKVRRYHEG